MESETSQLPTVSAALTGQSHEGYHPVSLDIHRHAHQLAIEEHLVHLPSASH
jgi:hypothetical protein